MIKLLTFLFLFRSVPQYEIVNIHSRTRRSTPDENGEVDEHRTVSFRALNKTLIIDLKPNKHIARNVPIFFAELDDTKTVVVKPAPPAAVST